jgi:hypothetical protein
LKIGDEKMNKKIKYTLIFVTWLGILAGGIYTASLIKDSTMLLKATQVVIVILLMAYGVTLTRVLLPNQNP